MDGRASVSPLSAYRGAGKGATPLNNNLPPGGLPDLGYGDLGVELLDLAQDIDLRPQVGEESGKEEKEEVVVMVVEEEEGRAAKRCRTAEDDATGDARRGRPAPRHPRDGFGRLSDEMVLGILRHLSHRTLARAALVCRRLRRLCGDESLWRRLDLGGRFLPSDTLAHVLLRGPRALRLAKAKISGPIFLESEPRLERFVSRVEYLDLGESTISTEDLERLLRTCRHLKKVSLEGCEASEGVCLALAANTELTTLNLALCSGLSSSALDLLLRSLPRLHSLNLAWTLLGESEAAVVCSSVSSSVRELNLSGSLVTDRDVERLVTRCGEMRELDVSDCWSLGPEAVALVVRHLSGLRGLSLSRCFRINLDALRCLRELPALERLNVFRSGSGGGGGGGRGGEEGGAGRLESLYPGVRINQEPFSRIARPTVGDRRTSIWQIRCRE